MDGDTPAVAERDGGSLRLRRFETQARHLTQMATRARPSTQAAHKTPLHCPGSRHRRQWRQNDEAEHCQGVLAKHTTQVLTYLLCPALPASHSQIIKTDQQLDTWRPRVHGTQLKALQNCRLPEQPEEFAAAEQAIASVKFALRVSSCSSSLAQAVL